MATAESGASMELVLLGATVLIVISSSTSRGAIVVKPFAMALWRRCAKDASFTARPYSDEKASLQDPYCVKNNETKNAT